jgi:outer membrane protein OmpA-like peptidoglycan-associated protein
MIRKGGYGADTLKGLSSAFSGGEATREMMASGAGLLDRILGTRGPKVLDWIAGAGGIGKDSASSLTRLVAPAVMGLLGKQVQSSNLNATGLGSLLAGQAGFLKNLIPSGLSGALGMTPFSPPEPPEHREPSVWKWLIPLLILAGILYFGFKSCAPVRDSVEKGTAQIGEAVDRLGRFLMVRLPSGIELNVPEFGVEKKLVDFIEDTGRQVDETTWFTFDRLEFETGSATLEPSSAEQLKNIVEILKAYPAVRLKIGGYTDNTGDPVSNLELSQRRAENTMQEMIRMGVDPARLQAEGYGESYPVADNATEEGRQNNRRIDLRVTAK